jgi:hypothetical protein
MHSSQGAREKREHIRHFERKGRTIAAEGMMNRDIEARAPDEEISICGENSTAGRESIYTVHRSIDMNT